LSNSNTLILNGSPHQNSHTMQLTTALFGKHPTIHVYDLDLKSCDDCKYCTHVAGCKFKKDDMTTVIEAINNADTLIIASPIYFGALSDQLLKVINRFQQFFSAKFNLNAPYPTVDKLYFVNTCGADNETMFDGARLTMNILASLTNAKTHKQFTLKNTDNTSVKAKTSLINEYKKQLSDG